MEKEKIGAAAPAHQILELLDQAVGPCDRRNLLAHGIWWGCNPEKQTILVRGGTRRPNEDQHVEMSVSEIDAVAEDFLLRPLTCQFMGTRSPPGHASGRRGRSDAYG